MRRLINLCLLAIIASGACALGQQGQVRFGLGVSVNPTMLFSSSSSSTMFQPVGLTNIYIPFMPSANFRIEPEGGIVSISSETSGSSPFKASSTSLRLGIGFFYVRPLDSTFSFYVGPRLGILASSTTYKFSFDPESKTSETDFFLGGCIGGEYAFSPHFSLGGEVQLNYISYGSPDQTPASISVSSRSQSAFTNNALMFCRWYF